MSSQFPASVDAELLLKNSLKMKLNRDDVKIINYDIKAALKPGENYFSIAYRATVEYEIEDEGPQRASFFIKCDNDISELEDVRMFEKELEMYTEILPQIKKLSEKCFTGDCLNFIESPVKLIVLEDLLPVGYKLADRTVGLDFEHCSFVLKKLAEFHACTMVLSEKKTAIFDNFQRGIFKLRKEEQEDLTFYTMSFKVLADLVQTWSGFEEIAKKLQRISDNFLDALYNCIGQTDVKIKVLNHGDCWCNNIMFKYDEISPIPIDLKFVDFQNSWYSSIGIDWNYFLFSSPALTVREQCQDELIGIYFESLTETLRTLQFDEEKIPTLEDVKSEIRKFEFYGLMSSVGSLPLFLWNDKENLPKVFECMNDEKLFYQNERILMENYSYQKTIKLILKNFDENGLLDRCV